MLVLGAGTPALLDDSKDGDGRNKSGHDDGSQLIVYWHYFELPCCMARQTRSGVAGISMWRMPRWASASTSAFATAGMAPTQPASPAPLTPSGLVLVGTGLL